MMIFKLKKKMQGKFEHAPYATLAFIYPAPHYMNRIGHTNGFFNRRISSLISKFSFSTNWVFEGLKTKYFTTIYTSVEKKYINSCIFFTISYV